MVELLTVADVASELKMAERTIQSMIAGGEMPGFRVRGQWRVRRADFESWLEGLATGSVAALEAPVKDSGSDAAEGDVGEVETSPEQGAAQPRPLATLTPRLSTDAMQKRFVEALGGTLVSHSDTTLKPLEVDLRQPVPERLRVYLFNATRPAGGRPLGEHKIQLVLPGMQRGERGTFDHSDGRMAILAGYSSEDDVFILWDAGLYENFAWSRNVQVKADTITQASAGILAQQERILRPRGAPAQKEIVLAADGAHLVDALRLRIDLTVQRLQEE